MRRQPAGIVRGQPISGEKLAFAKDMRREMTPEERVLWNELRQNRLNGIHFRRQQVIAGFIVDFYCDAARLAVELDGAYHDASYDAHRDRALARVGVKSCESKTSSCDAISRVFSTIYVSESANELARRPNLRPLPFREGEMIFRIVVGTEG